MFRSHRQIRARVHRVCDAALYGIAFWVAYEIRSKWPVKILGGFAPLGPFADYRDLLPYAVLAAFVVFSWQGFYKRAVNCSRRETFWPLLKSCAIVTAVLILYLFIFLLRTSTDYSRAIILLSGPVAFALIFLKEELVRWGFQSKFGHAQLRRRIILVGTASDLTKLRGELDHDMASEISIVKEIDLNEVSLVDFIQFLHEHSVNGVVLNARHIYFGLVEKVIQACELEGVEVWLMADFFKTQISKTTMDELHGKPVLVFRSTPDTSWQSLIKITFDRVCAFVGLILLSIPFLLVALFIKLTSPGPIFFKQKRSGLNGQPFTMYKFRTMVTNAEQRRFELESMNEMTGPVFKLASDPRITKAGRVLRRLSIDELPQLWNVLKGEMSIVGPRPLPVDEVKRFEDLAHRRRLSVKPGLTCIWQVSGRNNITDFKDWVRMDLEYIDNWSLWLDIKIVFQTVPVVLFAKGAK
jgi:exopolysaccharide biosynthesis polyprenyl glycosylphosphotransferase